MFWGWGRLEDQGTDVVMLAGVEQTCNGRARGRKTCILKPGHIPTIFLSDLGHKYLTRILYTAFKELTRRPWLDHKSSRLPWLWDLCGVAVLQASSRGLK